MKNVDMNALQIFLLSEVQHIDKRLAIDWLENTVATVSHDVDMNENVTSIEDRTSKIENLVKWHIKNLNGFGSFEISVLHTEFKGGFYPFEASAASIVSDKLGINSPTAFGGSAELKEIMLPVAKKKFLQAMPLLAPYSEGISRLYDYLSSDNKAHSWMKGGRFNLYKDINNETWLVDFKFPESHESAVQTYESPAQYHRASIALQKAQFELAGIKIDHTCVCPFSLKLMSPMIAEIVVDSIIIKEVLDAGDKYWGNVQENIIPQRPTSKNFELISEVPPQLRKILGKFILDKKVESIGKNAAAKAKERLLELCSVHGIEWDIEDKKTLLPGVSVSKTSKLYENTGLIKEDFRKLGGNPDDEKYRQPKLMTTVSLVRGKSSPAYQLVGDVSEIVDRVYKDAQEDLGELINVTNEQHLVKDPSDLVFTGDDNDFDDFDELDPFTI
jgi:hypothetical protein